MKMEESPQAKLSKGILDMKFMKRTKERVEKELDDVQGRAMYSNEITEEMQKTGNIIFTETSIFHCKNLIEGRLSFRGMNPEIEKLMGDYNKQKQDVEKKRETDVADVEMAQDYLANTVGNKFNTKRNRNRNKRQFLKPSDD